MAPGNLAKNNLAGVIVLYNPDSSTLTNIVSYINFLSHLYVIDNSDVPDTQLVLALCNISANISYHPFGENSGIAKALNQGCSLAARDGYSWILTMDQDSFFENSAFFDQVLNNTYANVAIIAASYNNIHFKPKPSTYPGLLQVDYVITSGNILNIAIWQSLGGFVEKLFIDEVDNEFCIRARNKGFEILASSDIYLLHKLGEGLSVKHFLTGKQLVVSKHPPLRVYYVLRNNLYIWRKFIFSHPAFVANRIRNIGAMVFKILLYFPDKSKYFRYIGKAIKDSLSGKYGKFSN